MYSHHSKNGTNRVTADVTKRDAGDILLEVDNWRLIKARFPPLTGVGSYPIHMCGRNPEGYGVHRNDTFDELSNGRPRREGRCIKCNEMMPNEIQGLWTLHNWDTVTKGHS